MTTGQLIDVAVGPASAPVRVPRGQRAVWLAGDGVYAIQRRHQCRDQRGRWKACASWCPAWDDLRTAPTAADLTKDQP